MENSENNSDRILIYNALTEKEVAAVCDSELWIVLNFAFGEQVRLSTTSDCPDGSPRSNILIGSATVGTVTWL